MKPRIREIVGGIAIACLCSNTMAAFLDFTDATTSFMGTVDGVGYTLTSSDGTVNFDEGYDGSMDVGCQSSGGLLACVRDGVGINNDEITTSDSKNQKLTLEFDTAVYIDSLYFLDLYLGIGMEQATITIDGMTNILVDAVQSSGQGGYASYSLLTPMLATIIDFTGTNVSGFRDDSSNDYAFAGVEVSAVPIPAAVWLFGSGLIGIGLARIRSRRKTA